MRIPKGMTEAEVLTVLTNVANRLARKFRFGYHDVDDMKQEAMVEGIKGLEKYQSGRPLENFLYIHVRNRLFNFKRDNFARPGPVLDSHSTSKRNIMCPIDISGVRDEYEPNMRQEDSVLENICQEETESLINKHLPVSMRADYLKVKYNIKIPKSRKDKLEQTVQQILKDNGYDRE